MTREDFVWSYVDIDPDEVRKLQTLVLNNLPKSVHFFQGLESFGVKTFLGRRVHRLVMIRIAPFTNGVIHVDDQSYNNTLALNLPLTDCVNSYTDIWKSNAPMELRYTINNNPYNYIDPSKCELIDRFSLDKPVLFRIDLPHSANNVENNKVRRALSVRFYEEPWDLVGL